MIKALLRFIFFEIPSAFVSGLSYILFDKEEIIEISRKIEKHFRLIISYLH